MKRSNNTCRRGRALTALVSTIALLTLALSAIWWLRAGQSKTKDSESEIVVYCAAGLRPAVEPILGQYTEEFGTPISVHYGPSGGLESQIEMSERGDLFIPAAVDPFLKRLRQAGKAAEILPVAKLQLVMAVSPDSSNTELSLQELQEKKVSYGLCNPQAAAGQLTVAILEQTTLGSEILAAPKATFPTVTELAGAIRDGGQLEAGILWDTTARQFGLRMIDAPELAESESTVGVAVLETSESPVSALKLARYMAARDRGQTVFRENHYQVVTGDRWSDRPSLTLYSGTINRNAIKESLREFEQRENCVITTVFDGCGTLVGMMKAGSRPDAYFACDVSYVEQVSKQFGLPREISDNQLVLIVRKGNPADIREPSDLADSSIDVGLCDPELSALGSLSKRLLTKHGIYEAVVKNGAITTTTGDLLVAQMLAGDQLDAALVYEANCIKALDQLDIVRLNDGLAKAIQPFSIHRETEFPQLAERLRDYLSSEKSAARFRQWGFGWRAVGDSAESLTADGAFGPARNGESSKL